MGRSAVSDELTEHRLRDLTVHLRDTLNTLQDAGDVMFTIHEALEELDVEQRTDHATYYELKLNGERVAILGWSDLTGHWEDMT